MVVIMRDESKTASDQARDFQVEVSLRLQEGLLKRVYLFDLDDKVWYAKLRVVNEIGKGVKDVLNYGFYEPPCNGRSGKFLDEERTFRDYPQRKSPAELEFKYKRRVYKSLQYDGKTLQKIHTKSNLKKLYECVSSNLVSQVIKWTEKGLDPNFQDDKTGETPLTVAINGEDRKDLILALVNGGAHLDYRAGDGLTPMHKAAIAGKARSIKILLDLGCPPNIKDQKGLTPLYYSVLHGGDSYCTQLLLDEHAEMGVSDHQGMQEIHHACKKGLVQHLEHLIFYGADIDVTTSSGNTPLHITAANNQEECSRVLLFRGAKRDILNYANQSAYEVAAVAGNKDLAEFIRTFTDGQIVKISEKPTYSTRRRKTTQKPRASSLFPRTASNASTKSDSSLPSSPRSSSGSHRSSNADTISLEENGLIDARVQRSMSVCSTTSDSSYCSESEILEPTVDQSRSRAKKNRSRDGEQSMAPPVKIVSGAATIRKRLYANVPGRRYIAVRDYIPCMGGELEVVKGDIVEVLYVGEKGFWEGRIDDRTGWFPSSYVEELKKGDKARPKTLFGRPSSLTSIFSKNEAQGPAAPLPDDRYIQPARIVILNRGKKGFGFQMRGANCQAPRLNFKATKEFPALQYIGEVEPHGEAESKGVKTHDFILEVNDEDVTKATHSHVVNLIKRSGKSVKLKILTVPRSDVNGMDSVDGYSSLAYNSLRVNRVPPPLPQRDPSTTLTLGRMRTHNAHSRTSLFESGFVYSQEEPARVDSVIAVSKDSPWHTLQRQKPGISNSRSAAQFKFNGGGKPKSRNQNLQISSAQRSKSMQNIASLQSLSSYDTLPSKRPVSSAVPFAIPQVPLDRYSRSISQDVGSASVSSGMEIHSHSDPNLGVQKLQRSMSMNDSREQTTYSVDTSATNFGSDDVVSQEATIVATPVSMTVDQESEPSATVWPVYNSHNSANQRNEDFARERKHSLGSKTSEPFNLSNALQKAVDARNERMNEQVKANSVELNGNNRKSSAPSAVATRRRTNTNEKFRSDMLSHIQNTELQTDEAASYSSHSTAISLSEKDEYSTLNRSYSNESITLRPGFVRQKSSERPKSALEIRNQVISKPPVAPKPPTAPPPPPPVAPVVLPSKPTVQTKQIKGKKPDVPLTAVRQGLITVDALQAKKGTLKAVKTTDPETPKSSKSIHNLVGKLAGHGGKPTPMFGGNQHSHMLAKAVAARAARLAIEARESEHSHSPSSWEDESPQTIPYNTNLQKQPPVSPKKTPPPVPPKKRSPTAGRRPAFAKLEMDSPTRRKLYPPNINELSPDRLSSFSTEEDRTMMLFDDILRKEAESENWSLSSWNSSDSSTAAEIIAPPSFPGNGYDERKSSIGSATRPWYEYSSGSPSEDSLNASTEKISLVRPSLSQELQTAEGTSNFDSEKILGDRRRRFSNGDGNSMLNGKRNAQVKTTASDGDIHLSSIVQVFSQPNVSSKETGIVDSKDLTESAEKSSRVGNTSGTHEAEQSRKNDIENTDINKGDTSPTATSESDEKPKTECKTGDDGLVEQIFTTSTGVQIKLRLQPKRNPPTPQSDTLSTFPEPPSPIAGAEASNQDYTNDIPPGFIPPPPLDFNAFDDVPSPPLPPPPEFSPMSDSSEVFSPLPAPPMDFCDTDADLGSLVDPPSSFDAPTKRCSFEDKPLLEWNCDDVCDWLESLNLSQYKETFRENDIQGVHLPELTKAELQELGIKSLGHRMTMENSVSRLCHPLESNC